MSERRRTAKEIKAYCEAAAKGPWRHNDYYIHVVREDNRADILLKGVSQAKWGELRANLTFSANARTDLPTLLEDAVRLRRALRRYVNCETHPVGSFTRDNQLLDCTAYLEDSEGSDE